MEAVSTRALAVPRTELLTCALIATASALLVALLGPPGGDAAAHLYRTELVEKGVLVWDNLWFGGHYPFASYSILYYLGAALVGNEALVAAAAVTSAALFAALTTSEWDEAARWPARVFAVLAAGSLFTGTYSYAVGIAAALGALRLLQLRRPWLAAAAGAATLGFSPLAFAFLAIALAAVALARRRVDLRLAAGLALAAAAELALLALFPSDGRYPFSPLSLAAAVSIGALGAALTARDPRARPLTWLFVLWALVCLAAFVVPSPFGDNLTRLRMMVLPLVLLAAALVGFRPRLLAAAALALAAVHNFGPDVSALPKRLGDERTAEASFWRPALEFARAHTQPGEPVEVVPTFGHWEAYWVPRAGLPLARGWYRQIDLAENPELYRTPLDARAYRRWLRDRGVRLVLVPNARLGPMGAAREAALLASGAAGLPAVFHSADWTIYAVDLPRARVQVTRFTHEVVAGAVATRGVFPLPLRWTPYRAVSGPVCVERARDGTTLLRALRPGRFELRASLAGSRRCGRV
jgi:hypothetical protein